MPWTGRRFYVMNDDMFGVSHSDHVERRAIRRPGGGCPFDSQDADVILRSSDGSSVLGDMFTIPQPDPAPIKPTAEVTEGSAPVVETPNELGEIISVLVDKYDAESIIPPAKEHLKRYIVDEPLAAYVIAYTIRWEDLGIATARQTLKLRLRSIDAVSPPYLDRIPATAYHNLLHYHHLCGLAAKAVTTKLRWIPSTNNYVWFKCTSCAQVGRISFQIMAITRAFGLPPCLGSVLTETPGMDLDCRASFYDALQTASQYGVCREAVFRQFPAWVKPACNLKLRRPSKRYGCVELKF
ncbi:hypothetical protein B0H14DRAFT_2746171 [Mycena olivaceomarginata]|nr:hypothetical protein B0H14DRAFT_2746171 [Mycena olivaceomarginata]